MAYLLDSNVFMQAKNLHYGFDFCPAFWDWIDARATERVVLSIDKVRDELIAGDDQLSEWAEARSGEFFLKPDALSYRVFVPRANGRPRRDTHRQP